jgi:hypothetical protein
MPRGVNDYDAAMLQGRNVASANSLSIVSPGLITDGLVLNLDAGNFVSYPAANTTWFDVSNNRNNGTLTNGPTYSTVNGGAINFDGVNDRVILTETFGMTPPVLTIEIGFRPSFALNTTHTLAFRQNTRTFGSTQAYQIILDVDFSIYIYTATAAGAFSQVGTDSNVITAGTDYMLTAVLDSTTMSIYLNGQFQTPIIGGTKAALNYSTTQTLRVGGGGPAGYTDYLGSIYFYRMYNRVLSATEIQQNFNASRARLGI